MNSKIHFSLATPEDGTKLFPFWSDYEVTRFTLIRNIKSVGDCEVRILKQLEMIKRNGGLGPYCVSSTGTTIGYCGATTIAGQNDEYEIFYNIGKTFWGRGFGTAIAAQLIYRLFEEQNASGVIAFAVSDNVASWKILEKLGMKRVETIPEDFESADGKQDLYKYSIRRGEPSNH